MTQNQKFSVDIQRVLFERLKNEVANSISLVDALADLLNISNDAVYRRMRGEKRLDIDELTTICAHFNISFDTLAGSETNSLLFNYSPLDLSNIEVYKQYMKQLLHSFAALSKSPDKEVFFTAVDIPMFHFMPYPELTLFKVFTWSNSTGAFTGNFSEFCDLVKDDELLAIFKQLDEAYSKIPSVEIWTDHTFDAILRLIDYYFESGYLASKDEALLLCSQLLQLTKRMEQWATQRFKDEQNKQVPYRLYLSDIELENNFVILRNNQSLRCIIKLYTINSMTTTHPGFCSEAMAWIDNSMRKSTLISGASQRESFKFFNLMTQKVRYMIERIESSKSYYGQTAAPFGNVNGLK